MPLFSVIIPTYNRRELLAQTLESVWGQTFKDYEVIVVDDGSTDGTWEWLGSQGSRLRALRQKNSGSGAARNLGAGEAGGDYLAFLDSDDLWFPWTLQCFSKVITSHDHPAILCASVFPFVHGQDLADVRQCPPQEVTFPDFFSASPKGYSVGAGMAVMRRADFLHAGGFPVWPIHAEDHDLTMRMGLAKGFVQILEPSTLACRMHPGNVTNDTSRLAEGVLHLLAREQSGAYPGGRERALLRREILCRHMRPVSLRCLREHLMKSGCHLYAATFLWHLQLHRWKYLLGFPWMLLRALASRPAQQGPV